MPAQPTHRSLSRRTALAGLGVGGLAAGMAQLGIAAPDSTTEIPLVGMWQWNSGSIQGPASFAIFHADGTYTEWQPVAGAAIGLWRMTGERTADLMFVFADTDPALDAYAPGTATFMITLELDDTGNAFAAQGIVSVRDTNGGELGAEIPWSRPAIRVTFETNPSTGSTVSTTPAVATPAP